MINGVRRTARGNRRSQHSTDDTLITELLRAAPKENLADRLLGGMLAIQACKSQLEMFAIAADEFYALTGYDRVMVYRFDDDGHGQVVAETFEKDLEPFLGTRYPASDIPQMARRLFLENRVRMLVDVDYEPVRIAPRLSSATGQELDMSMCFLRSISPLHIQYLKNMGVAATLVVSIVVGGKLWGLISCHHYTSHEIPRSVCTASEFLSEVLAIRIAEFEARTEAQADLAVRRFETHVMQAISFYGDWKSGLFGASQYLLQPMDASGAALFIDNDIHTSGEVPSTRDLREIRKWMNHKSPNARFHTVSLTDEDKRFKDLFSVASGLVSIPVSKTPGEYLMWFRPQQLRTDIWGGDPSKAVQIGNDPMDLSPRRSFAKWLHEVEGTSVPWASAALHVAERIGQSIADALLHSRAVRAVIADDQLKKAVRQVGESGLPVIMTDSSRKLLLVNEAFHALLPPGVPHLERLEDLPKLFEQSDQFRRSLTDLCDRQLAWRGEVQLRQGGGPTLKLLLRADPVRVAQSRVLGFLLMFMDMSEMDAVQDALRQLQQAVLQQSAAGAGEPKSARRLMHRRLLSAFVNEAENAALEITNGFDVTRIPQVLESVRGSVGRSADLLERLMLHVEDDDATGSDGQC